VEENALPLAVIALNCVFSCTHVVTIRLVKAVVGYPTLGKHHLCKLQNGEIQKFKNSITPNKSEKIMSFLIIQS
jgi:hypothetical protein